MKRPPELFRYLFAATALLGVVCAQAALVPGGDFRSGKQNWQLVNADGQPASSASWKIEGGGMQPEDQAAKILSKTPEVFRLLATAPVPIQAGKNYRFSALVRVPSWDSKPEIQPGPLATLEIQFLDDAKAPIQTVFISQDGRTATPETLGHFRFVGSSNPWALYAGVLAVPAGASSARVGLRVEGLRGGVELTDVQVAETAQPLSPAITAPDQPPTQGPLVSTQEFFARLRLDDPALSAVKAAVESEDEAAAAAAYLDYRRKQANGVFSATQRQKITPAPGESFALADRITQGFITDDNYNQFKGEVFVGDPINWNFNPRQPSDPDYTREFQWCILNRMGFWNKLADAYRKTSDEKYAVAWINQMTGFVEGYPVVTDNLMEDSTHWRGIETGLRISFAWPAAYYAFLDSPSLTPEAHLLFCRSVLDHADLLQRVIAFFPHWGGNHRLMEAAGLLTIGLLFPEFQQSQEFTTLAFVTAEQEVARQFYPDGAQTELTMSYHWVSQNLLEVMIALAEKNQYPVPPALQAMRERMYRYYVTLMDQKGILPVFNDTTHVQDGSFYSKNALKLWPGDSEFLFAATLGKEGKAPALSSFLPYAGLYAMRSSWNPDGIYVAFDGGPVGTGHWHEDKLNFILKAFGDELLTEAGHHPYDQSPFRWYAISTTGHNTGTVDGKEQRRGVWSPDVKMEPVNNPWFTTPEVDYVSATYDSGYQKAEYDKKPYFPMRYPGDRDMSVSQIRHLLFVKPDIVLCVDFFKGTAKHRFDLFWHLNAPDAQIDEATQVVRTLRPGAAQLQITPLMNNGLTLRKAIGEMNPPLGWVPKDNRKIATIVMTKTEEAPAVFANVLTPFRNDPVAVTGESVVSDGKTWSATLRQAERTITVFLSADHTPQRYERAASATNPALSLMAGMVVSEENRIDASAVSNFEAPGLRLTSSAPASLRFTHTVRSPGWWENLMSFGKTQPAFDWQITNVGAESVTLTINDQPQTLAPASTLSVEKH